MPPKATYLCSKRTPPLSILLAYTLTHGSINSQLQFNVLFRTVTTPWLRIPSAAVAPAKSRQPRAVLITERRPARCCLKSRCSSIPGSAAQLHNNHGLHIQTVWLLTHSPGKHTSLDIHPAAHHLESLQNQLEPPPSWSKLQ